MLRLQKAFLKEGSQARSKVCKETINKDRNILSGIKKLLDATEWPEGIENWKGNTAVKDLTPLLYSYEILVLNVLGLWPWHQTYSQTHPSVAGS